jgi:AcrR family transcriptional regulator
LLAIAHNGRVSSLADILDSAPPAKRAILRSALGLFATRGVEAVSVRDIAAASGFTNPALFRHFASKEALARALFEVCYRQLVDAMLAVEAEDSLRAWLTAVLGEIARAPEAVHFVLENVRPYWRGLPDELRARNLPALVRARLEREQRAGRLRPDLDIPMARTVIDGALAQIARGAHFRDGPLDPEATAAALADLLLRGMGPGPLHPTPVDKELP